MMRADLGAKTRGLTLGPYKATIEKCSDGSILMTSADPLRFYPRRYTERLLHWASEKPDATLLAQRKLGEWCHLTYAEAVRRMRHVAQALLDRGLSAERPLMILSGNSIEHGLLALAAQHVGVPFAPISPAYSLLSKSADRVRHAATLLTPGAVFAQDAALYEQAIKQAVPADVELIFVNGDIAGRPCTTFAELEKTVATELVEQAHHVIDGDTIAKFLFTSGSTKLPKAVINTQRMLTSSQQMEQQAYPFLAEAPPVLVDWMPWHHTAAGNHNMGVVIYNGGTMYIDEGKPTAAGMAQTILNLREVPSTIHYSVPKGLEALLAELRRDSVLRECFFRDLRLIFPCGASMPGPLQDAFDELAIQSVGERIPMSTGMGLTETAPFAMSAHIPNWRAGTLGIPAPGCDVRLVPCGDKLEIRYRGPNITPGYWRQPELTEESVDDQGYFCSGDAAVFIDQGAPGEGLRFNGRIAEDFKLASGTWVNVGALRSQIIEQGAPYVHDAVITGHDRDELGMMLVLLPTVTEISPSLNKSSKISEIAANAKVRDWLLQLLNRLAASGTGSSNRIVRALILNESLSMELGEITDKGSINQRAILKNRAHWVDKLYADQTNDDAILVATSHLQATVASNL